MNKWDKVFKNGPNEICGRQPLKNLKWNDLFSRPCHFRLFKGCLPKLAIAPFLNSLSQIAFKMMCYAPKSSASGMLETVEKVKGNKETM